MDSKSKTSCGTESATSTLSMDSAASGSEHDRSVLMRSRKEFDLTTNFPQSPLRNASTDSQGPLRGKGAAPSSDHMRLLWRRPSPPLDPKKADKTNLEDKTVTCSVLKELANRKASSSQPPTRRSESTGVPANRGSRSGESILSTVRSHFLAGATPPKSDITEAEAFLTMVNVQPTVSFEMLRDVNGTVDTSDLGIPDDQTITRDLISNGHLRNARGSTDITQVLQDMPVDDLYNVSHPVLRNAIGRMNLSSPDTPRMGQDGRNPSENRLGESESPRLHEYWVRGNGRLKSSSEVEIRTTEAAPESIPRVASATTAEFQDVHQGTRLDLRINVERGSEGSVDRRRTVTLLRSTHGSCDLAARAAMSRLRVNDDHLHPVLKHAEADTDLPATAAHKFGGTETLVRVNHIADSPSEDIITPEQRRSLQSVASSRSKFAKVIKKAASGNDNASGPSRLSGNDDARQLVRAESCPFAVVQTSSKALKKDKDKQVNFILSTSEFDLVYAPDLVESQEESPIHPGIKSPTFSAGDTTSELNPLQLLWKASDVKYILHPNKTNFTQDEESNNEVDSTPRSTELYQIYMANTKKQKNKDNVSASSSAGEAELEASSELKTLENSDSEPSSASSASVEVTESMSLLETLQHSGSARLLDNLPGLDGQWGQFDKPYKLPTAQEQQEVEEEMLRLATRSKRYVPPMELGLYEWESIVQVLGMNEPLSVQRVLCRLSKMTTKRYCDLVRLYKCGLYDNVLSLLLNHPEAPLIQNLTMKLIAELSCLPECRLQILQCPRLIFQCITLLEDDNSLLHFHEYSSKILSAVAKDKSIQLALLYEHNLIEVLLRRIINTPDPDVRCNCMEMMLRVANNESTCKRVIRSDQFTLDLFIALIDSKYAKIQQLALGMLVLLTRYETELAFQECLQECGLAELMITILKTESMLDFSHLVVTILCNIANTEFGLNFLRYSGAIKFLVDYIDQEGKEDILGCGLDIVVKLTLTKTGRALLVEFDVPARLVRYLKHEDDTTLERACVAIANEAQNLEALCVMVANRPAEDLIGLIFEDTNSSQLKYAASRALFEFAGRDDSMCQQIAELHLTEVFHHIIWSGFAHVQTLATISDIIQIISHYPALKSHMIDDESVACFLDIIQGHCRQTDVSEDELENEESLRISGMQCLRCYLSDPVCRKLFSNAFGVYVLKNNLESSSILIRQATAVFIELAARDPTLAAEMVVAGIVQIMRNDKPMMAACPAWQKGLQQIYDNHLPSKFAYCHRLDLGDITVDGFYIAATRKGNIEVLDNLLHERMCPLETIYVCNFSAERPQPDRSVHVLMRPKWQPYVRPDAAPYPPALSRLGERSVAKIWRRKLSLLYGDKSPKHSPKNSLELSPEDSPSSSLAFGRRGIIRNRTSSLNRRIKSRKNKSLGRSLSSVKSYHDLPKVPDPKYAELNACLEKYGVCPIDHALGKYLEQLRVEIQQKMGNDDEDEEDSQNSFLADKGLGKVAEIIAKFVALRMSGNTDNMPNLVNFFNVSVWELKERGETNILPLGHLKAGLYLERALLFKVLSDRIGLPCTLVRGEYGIAFNEICVPCPNNEFPLHWQAMRPNYIVDLMRAVGDLYFVETREAFNYCNAPY